MGRDHFPSLLGQFCAIALGLGQHQLGCVRMRGVKQLSLVGHLLDPKACHQDSIPLTWGNNKYIL